MYDENEVPSRPNALRGLLPVAALLAVVLTVAAVLALVEPSRHEREAFIAPDTQYTPAQPTPGAIVPVDAPAAV